MHIEPEKRWALALLIISILILLILSMGITGLKLSPGLLMNFTRSTPISNGADNLTGAQGLIDFVRIVLALALVLFPIYLVYMLIHPQRRKKLLRDLLIFGMLIFFFDRLRAIASNMEGRGAEVEGPAPAEGLPPMATIQPLSDYVQNPPNWIVGMVIGVVVIVLATAIFGVLWYWAHRRTGEPDAISRVSREAEDALLSIQSGGDLRDTIIQCYRSMVRAVKEERGIHRDVAVTPREFIHILTSRGIPPRPVESLTHLFEDARYGKIEGGMRQKLEAVSALEEIIEACRKQKEAS
uniref:DUF4129 domain-containing protein n=1 Tax=Anaerolinea thermolimosa TaxID=229919 RepID=A0A7C4PQK1_9CHLR